MNERLRRASVAAPLLVASACQELTPIARAHHDAAHEPVSADAPPAADIAPVDVAPDAAMDTALRGRLGLLPGVAVGADGDRDDVFRLVYVDTNGALHAERRDADTLARLCEVDLGAPPEVRIEGAPVLAAPVGDPAVALPGGDVLVRTLDARGRAQLWTRTSTRTPGPCGASFGPWQALPDGPVAWASAPDAFAHVGDAMWQRLLVAVTGADGAVYVLERPLTSGPWGAWRRFDLNAPGERAVARPTLVQRGWNAFSLGVLSDDGVHGARLREQSCFVRSMQCRPAWVELPLAPARAATPLRWTVAAADPATVGGSTDQYYGYRVLGDERGRVWAQSFFTSVSPFAEFGDWVDLGAPYDPRSPLALAFGLRRSFARGVGDAILLATSPDAPRVLRHTRCTPRACEAAARGWPAAPDPLR